MPGKRKGAQASLEYLITYGWALVMIATVIGVLVFVGSGNVNQDTCTTYLQFICRGIGADGDSVVLVLQNATGQKITINPFTDILFDGQEGYAIVKYMGTDYRFDDVTIGAGDEFEIRGIGRATGNRLSLTYYEHATGLTRTIESSFATSAPDDIEISNDGIDTDGDGLVDCADPDVTGICEYVLEGTTAGTTVSNGFDTEVTFSRPAEEGEWTVTSGTITFYVTSYNENQVGLARKTGFPSYESETNANIKEGWNYIIIDPFTPETLKDINPTLTIDISSDSGTFEIDNAENAPLLISQMTRQ